MTLTLPGLLILIVIAALCGMIGKALAGGTRGGLLTSIAVGFIGAVVGPWIANQMDLSEPLTLQLSGQSFPIVWSIIGGAVFVALLHLISRRR